MNEHRRAYTIAPARATGFVIMEVGCADIVAAKTTIGEATQWVADAMRDLDPPTSELPVASQPIAPPKVIARRLWQRGQQDGT